jgi:hypothetical protein
MHLFAYIDPGSGSLLLQAILAAIISIPFFFRRTIGGALSRLRGGVRRHSVDAGPEGSEPSEH